jgi:hypothetical protein
LQREVDALIATAADLPRIFPDVLDTIVRSVIAAEPLARLHAPVNEGVAL